MPVKDAARLLGVSERRIRQLLVEGGLQGRRFGEAWQVSAADLARLQSQQRLGGRPLGARRAWALLDLLGGGSAEWLSPSGRSQLRRSVGRFRDAAPDRWRSALRGRNNVISCVAHHAAIDRLVALPDVLSAGPSVASERGFDLVGGVDVAEVYVRPEDWPSIALSLAIREAGAEDANLRVRLPQAMWPFVHDSQVPDSVLAADLLEAPEPRAIAAGASVLNRMLSDFMRGAGD